MERRENIRNPRTEIETLKNQDNGIHLSFEVDVQLTENVLSGIRALVLSYLPNTASYSLGVQGFQPSSKFYMQTLVNVWQ